MADGGVLRELLAVFSFGVDTHELKEGENKLEEFFGTLKKLAVGIAGAFAVKEVYEFAEANVKAMSEIERTAVQLGISTDKVQAFQFAAKSLGLEADQLLNSMGRLQVTQQAAASGSAQGAAAFSAMGVSVKDSNGQMKSADDLLTDVAEGIKGVKDPSKQAAIAVQLFGRQGRQLLPLLKEGREGVEGLAEEFKQLGGGYTKEAIEQAKKFEKQSARLGSAWTGLKSVALQALLPILTSIINGMTKAVSWIREMTKNSQLLHAIMIVLGTAAAGFAIAMTIAFAPILLAAVAIAALVLLVDDLIVLFKGGDSVIGRAIDKMFGKGTSADVVESLSNAWKDVSGALSEAGEVVKPFWDFLKWIVQWADKINGVFDRTLGKQYAEYKGDALAAEQRKPLVSADEFRQRHRVSQGLPVEGAVSGTGAFLQPSVGAGSVLRSETQGSSSGTDHNIAITVHADEGTVAKVVHKVNKSTRRASAATLPKAGS